MNMGQHEEPKMICEIEFGSLMPIDFIVSSQVSHDSGEKEFCSCGKLACGGAAGKDVYIAFCSQCMGYENEMDKC